MKRALLFLLALTVLVLGLNGVAYKSAKVLGGNPVYPLAVDREGDALSVSCFGYRFFLPLP